MNIKRAVLALGAMILGVGFIGASPAFAVCTPPPVFHPTTQYPAGDWVHWPTNGHMRMCGTIATTDANTIKNTAVSATSSGVSTPAPQPRIRYTVGGTGTKVVEVYAWEYYPNGWNDMKAYFGVNPVPPPGTVLGYTFEPNANTIAVNIFNNANVGRVTNHEIGHAVDRILGLPSSTPGSVYLQKLALDKALFNAKPITVFNNYGGLSTACAMEADNYKRMECTWTSNAKPEYELYASAYGARVPLGVQPVDLMKLLNTEFPNVRAYMDNVRKGNTLP
ncbi:MAG: hypothetical protein IT342_13070 [Candidatus Melainabacteria bacterium]|nr:hypothetical protein [Candidatus Melainabacteria bacterium]